MSSPEKFTKVVSPLAAAIGGIAVGSVLGSFVRGRKARRREDTLYRMALNTGLRAHQTAVENDRLRHEIAHDDLTGLRTKKSFIKTGDKRLSEAKPDQVFALAMFDLDNFKAVNDKHPRKYDAGDGVLKRFTRVLLRSVRGEDKSAPDILAHGSRDDDDIDVARLSGDEFAGLFDITPRNEKGAAMSDEERAAVFCDRITSNFAAEFDGDQELQKLKLGVSVGIVIRRPGETMASMLSRAATPLGEEKQQHHAENGAYRS